MDCAQDLEFNMPDDSGRALEKAKESILLMKKKMFRSHDLILQYNNKLKECERLKEDLSLAQEEAIKFKRENSLNLTKVVKLEMQSANSKKIRQELEQKIAEKDIQIASDKSHLKQLDCKLSAVEEKHAEKDMEAELNRSSLEVKTKELEQELKALKRSHMTEVNKLEKALKSPNGRKGRKIIEGLTETKEIGINTDEEALQALPKKPTTANKMVLTNEFYHIRNDPYPIFCNRCESLMKPTVEKICQIMTKPPLGSNILSPIKACVSEMQKPNLNDLNNPDSYCPSIIPNDLHRNESIRPETNLSDTRRLEPNYNESTRIEQYPRNFVSPLPSQLSAKNAVHEFQPNSVDMPVPEFDSLRRKIEVLERKIKKQKIQKSSDPHPSNCCNHQHPLNYYGPSSTHVNPVPNVSPNVQADVMAEFFNKIMNIANQRDLHQEKTKHSARRKGRTLRDKRARNKLRKLKKMGMLKKKSNQNWEVETDESNDKNDSENRSDPSDPTKPHLLRIKPSSVNESPVTTLFSDTESEKLSPMKNSQKPTFAEAQTNRPESLENPPQQAYHIESNSHEKSLAKAPDKRKLVTRGRKRERASLFSDDGESEIEVKCGKNTIIEGTRKKLSKNSVKITKIRNESLRKGENERKSLSTKKIDLEEQNTANTSLHSTIKESVSFLSHEDARDSKSSVLSRKDETNKSPSNFEEIDEDPQTLNKLAVVESDVDHNDTSPETHSNSDPLECTNLGDGVETRKHKNSNSLKATKCSGQSNLLGKLRALNKSSVMNVSKTNNSPTIHTTRSLSRRKLTEQSDNDDIEIAPEEGKRTSAVSNDETSVPVKKQRIAHVPKRATSVQSDERELSASTKPSELIESSDELRQNTDEKMADIDTPAIIKRPLTRRSAVRKPVQNEPEIVRETIKTGKVGRPRLVAGPTTGRRGRPPGKRNAAKNAQLALDLETKELADVESKAESMENQVNAENNNDRPVLQEKRDIDPKDLTKALEISSQKIEIDVDSRKNVGSTDSDETSESRTVEAAKLATDLIVQSKSKEGSLTQSIHAAGDRINERAVARALQVDKSSAAASIASLDEISLKPAEISILPNRSTVLLSATTIENKELKEKVSCANSSIAVNALDVSLSVELPADKENSKTPEILNDSAQNVYTLAESKNLLNGQTVKKIISSVFDESPASPDSTQNSPTKDIEITTSESMNRDDRVSIYDNVGLSIPLDKTANSIEMNFYVANDKNRPAYNTFTPQDKLSDLPIEKPIERKVVVYDTNLHDNVNDEEFDSKNIVKPQFFVETSMATTKKARTHSGSSVESISVVKELRSRQVLSSPSTSENPQDLNKTGSTSNDEPEAHFPSQIRELRPDSYTGIRSLGTLLNHHLGEQKKKRSVKNAKLRRAAANKLQAAAEKNVKMELDKLVESEEWTSELHRSVLTRLTDVRSERTVAKSIVDFLLERALLDEPLDRTYTPPAPVMTKTQQRIVTLMNCLNRVETMAHVFDMVQAGIEYNVFKLGLVQSVETIEYLFRIFTVIARLRKDRERIRILCCDAFYFLGRRAIPAMHVILTVWPEVLPKHGAVGSELPDCLAHMIKQERVGKDPFPKVLALKKLITNYYEYPQTQPVSAAVMTVLMKALHEKYSSDLEVSIIMISKREGSQWVLDNVIEKGLMKIIQDDSYQWQYEVLKLLGFLLRSFATSDVTTLVKKFVDLLCQKLDSTEGSPDKQEGIVAALLSLSRYKTQFGRISDSVLKWMPKRHLRATTLQQLDSFFKSHPPAWWNTRLQYKMKNIAAASDKNN